MELCEDRFCMLSTNLIVFCTEWFYSTAHCLQEKPHQSHGTPGEIWGFNPSYHRGRTMFQLVTKHSFSYYSYPFLLPIFCPLHSSLIYLKKSPKPHRCRGVKLLLLCFAVWPHTNTCGCLHGPLEHCPPSAAERSLSRCH